MGDKTIMKLSALYIDDILKCYKSLRDIAADLSLHNQWFCNIVYRLDI